jgi:hypothetical protein
MCVHIMLHYVVLNMLMHLLSSTLFLYSRHVHSKHLVSQMCVSNASSV